MPFVIEKTEKSFERIMAKADLQPGEQIKCLFNNARVFDGTKGFVLTDRRIISFDIWGSVSIPLEQIRDIFLNMEKKSIHVIYQNDVAELGISNSTPKDIAICEELISIVKNSSGNGLGMNLQPPLQATSPPPPSQHLFSDFFEMWEGEKRGSETVEKTKIQPFRVGIDLIREVKTKFLQKNGGVVTEKTDTLHLVACGCYVPVHEIEGECMECEKTFCKEHLHECGWCRKRICHLDAKFFAGQAYCDKGHYKKDHKQLVTTERNEAELDIRLQELKWDAERKESEKRENAKRKTEKRHEKDKRKRENRLKKTTKGAENVWKIK